MDKHLGNRQNRVVRSHRKNEVFLTRIYLSLILVCPALSLFTNLDMLDVALLNVYMLVAFSLSILIIRNSVESLTNKIFIIPITLYLSIFYIIEPFLLLLPANSLTGLFYGSVSRSDELIVNALPFAFSTILGFLTAICIFTYVVKKKPNPKSELRNKRVNVRIVLLVSICFFGLFFKLLINNILRWGLPGELPINVIPLLTGVSVFLASYGVLVFLSFYLYYSMVLSGSRRHLILSALFIMAYLTIDLANGSKYSIMFLLIIFGYINHQRVVKSGLNKARAYILTAFGSIAVLSIYPYINYVRFARLRDDSFTTYEKIDFALANTQNTNPVAEIMSRIASFESFSSALTFLNGLNIKFSDILFSDELIISFTQSVSGIKGAVNYFGTSQPAFIIGLLKGGKISSYLFSIAFLLVILFTVNKLFIQGIHNRNVKAIGALIFSLVIIHLLFGTGNLIYFFKEFFVIGICLWILDNKIVSGRPS